jgi:hypothetical protein
MADHKDCTVGEIRQQTALSDADRRVVLVTKNEELLSLVKKARVVRCYPDTTDECGNWNATFKIEVA